MTYILEFHQPLIGLCGGVVLMTLYFYLYVNRHKKIVPWLARNFYNHDEFSERAADSMFKVASSYLFMFAGLTIILALLYLTA